MLLKPKIYIAGPYSVGDVMENIRRVMEWGDKFLELEFAPYLPHLSGFWHLHSHKSYKQWLDIDNQWLASCDCLFCLEGESSGADKEVKLAATLGIPVIYEKLYKTSHPDVLKGDMMEAMLKAVRTGAYKNAKRR